MITLVVAVATGFAVPAVHAAPRHGQVVASVTTSAVNPGSCDHGGCPIGQNAEMHANCSVTCSGVSGVMPGMTGVHFAGIQSAVMPSLDRVMVDRTIPPDPHPPKSA